MKNVTQAPNAQDNNASGIKPKKVMLRVSGGIHNRHPVHIIVSAELWDAYKRKVTNVYELLSANQRHRLHTHLCGIKGCSCGSYLTATYEEIDPKLSTWTMRMVRGVE